MVSSSLPVQVSCITSDLPNEHRYSRQCFLCRDSLECSATIICRRRRMQNHKRRVFLLAFQQRRMQQVFQQHHRQRELQQRRMQQVLQQHHRQRAVLPAYQLRRKQIRGIMLFPIRTDQKVPWSCPPFSFRVCLCTLYDKDRRRDLQVRTFLLQGHLFVTYGQDSVFLIYYI